MQRVWQVSVMELAEFGNALPARAQVALCVSSMVNISAFCCIKQNYKASGLQQGDRLELAVY